MANNKTILCGVQLHDRSGDALRLAIDGDKPNVFQRIEDMYETLFYEIEPIFHDLVDIATYVYAADQSVSRQSRDNGGSGWRRQLNFTIPVRCVERWKRPDLTGGLIDALSFLSEDTYDFEFVRYTKPKPWQKLIDFEKKGFDHDKQIEEVMLFSGGLDSLAGAVQNSIIDKRCVLLVNHRSTPKLGPRTNRVIDGLRNKAGSYSPADVKVRINKSDSLTKDTNQRTRSFLFASLAATFAHMIGLNRICFYENGVTSLNLPLAPQAIGARSSRTTHPKTLYLFSQLFGMMSDTLFKVENPFLAKTKAEVVQLIVDESCGDLITESVSCAHTHQSTNEHPHCGDCSQCIDRRFAVLAANADRFDPAERYRIDLLQGERTPGESLTLMAAYIDSATRIQMMKGINDFYTQYGMAFRALKPIPTIYGPPEQFLYNLYRRHAMSVGYVLDRKMSELAFQLRAGNLPETCLARLISGDAPQSSISTISSDESDNLFYRSGDGWAIGFAGARAKMLKDAKGHSYIHHLLSRLDRTIDVVVLVEEVDGDSAVRSVSNAGETLDKQALEEYRERISELNEEIEEARSFNDIGQLEKLQNEQSKIIDQITSNTNV